MDNKKYTHPSAGGFIYKIFVNGAFLNSSTVYDYAMNQGLGIAMHLGLDFKNTPHSPSIIDMWSDGDSKVIITKTQAL